MTISRVFALSFSVAVAAMGSAQAADEWSSFTDRVQQSQGIWQARGARMEESYSSAETAVPSEAASFFARIDVYQDAKRTATEAREGTPAISSEATSFTSRVMASQGIGWVGAGQGAAGGESGTR